MAFDEDLARRIREVTAGWDGVTERKMFGGLAFLLHGNMSFGIVGDELMVRVGKDGLEGALARPGTRVMDFTGRPARGMVYGAPSAIRTRTALRQWPERGRRVADARPGKAG